MKVGSITICSGFVVLGKGTLQEASPEDVRRKSPRENYKHNLE